MSKESRLVIYSDELNKKIADGAYKVYLLAASGYGPSVGNVMIEQKYGDPLLSRDGVTNIRRLYLEDPVENMTARAIIQASSMNNRNVGDGTTAVAMLAYFLYIEACEMVKSGINRMDVARYLKNIQYDVIEEVEKISIPFTKDMLVKVAETSTGDNAIAQMLEEIFAELGDDAGVVVESYGGADIYSEMVTGFYFNKGFTAVGLTNQPSNLKSIHEGNVPILITEKKLLTKSDIGPILQTCVKEGIRELILVGEVSPEVLEVLAVNWISGGISVVPVDVPYYEGLRTIFMDDLALLTDGVVFAPGSNGDDFNTGMLGYASKVVIDERSTKIVGGDAVKEAVDRRLSELKAQLRQVTNQLDVDILRERISRLNGKLAIIHVGSPTEIEREELKLRVDDAVCAIRAAFKGGVVPGGGVTLARVEPIYFKKAFGSLIKVLAINAGLDPNTILARVRSAKLWRGFNFKTLGKMVDLEKEGILDPTLVVIEIVKNATSIASSLITANAATVFIDRAQKLD